MTLTLCIDPDNVGLSVVWSYLLFKLAFLWYTIFLMGFILQQAYIKNIKYLSYMAERREIGISGSLIWSKPLMELIFNPCGAFWWSSEGPVSQIHSLHLHVGAPGILSVLLRSVQMLKRKWGVESNGKLPHIFTPGKTAALVSEFAVEDLPSTELQPWFLGLQRRTCPWSEHSHDDDDDKLYV